MKPLYQAFTAGLLIAACHALILAHGWTLWDVGIVGISALSAGVFFVLGMIYQSTIKDYKQASEEIAQCRGKLLSLQDLNTVAAQEEVVYDPEPFRAELRTVTRMIIAFIENAITLPQVHAAISSLLLQSRTLRDTLPSGQGNAVFHHHEDLRQSVSYFAFLKTHNFPTVGYVFLWFFAGFIILLQLFSEAQNNLLDVLFIFSLAAILVFFIAFIHDLDHPFRTHHACFTLDTTPLKSALELLEEETIPIVSPPRRQRTPLYRPYPAALPVRFGVGQGVAR